MSYFNTKELNELIRLTSLNSKKISENQKTWKNNKEHSAPRQALGLREIEKKMIKVISEPQRYFDLAKASLNILSTRGNCFLEKNKSIEHINDPSTYYYLRYFMQQTSASEAEILSERRLFENRAIMRYLNSREPHSQRNIWETLAQHKDPEINQFLVSHASHIEVDCPNSPGDLYSTAYQYHNYDLIQKLTAKGIAPQTTHFGQKNILFTAIKQNNQKVFTQIFDFLIQKNHNIDMPQIINQIFKKNAINIYEYLEKHHSHLINRTITALNQSPVGANQELEGILALGRHKNASFFKRLINNRDIVFQFKPVEDKIHRLFQTYFSYELTQYNKNPQNFNDDTGKFFERFDLKELGIRSFITQQIITFTFGRLHLENTKFFEKFLNNFLEVLTQTGISPENQQIMFSTKKGLYSFSQALMFHTSAAQHLPHFFENPKLHFHHNIEDYNRIISSKSAFDYEENLKSAPPHVKEFFQQSADFQNHASVVGVYLKLNAPQIDKWATPVAAKKIMNVFLSYPEFLNYTSTQSTDDKKELLENYTNISIIMERKNLAASIQALSANTNRAKFKL